MRVLFGVWLVGLTVGFVACGGRTLYSGSDDSEASAGSGAAASVGGTASQGARSGRGGAAAVGGSVSTGAQPSGGALGTAGTSASGGACVCPNIDCGPGYVLTDTPNSCCPHCEPQCNFNCPGIACGSGSHLETAPGQCCPTCVQDSCDAQRMSYLAFRQQLVDKYSTLGCATNSDCTLYYEKNQCNLGCGIPMPLTAIGNLETNLQSYAQQSCSPNCMQFVPPCPPQNAVCSGFRCVDSVLMQ